MQLFSPLTDRSPIEASCRIFQEWWDSCWKNHSYKQPCPCDGSEADLDALGYCSYELGFPDDDYSLTGIVWGQIIEKHTGLVWAREGQGELVLWATEYPRYVVYPRMRVCQIMNSSMTQFEQFAVLTEQVFYEMVASGFDPEEIPRFAQLAGKIQNSGGYSFTGLVKNVQEEIGASPES